MITLIIPDLFYVFTVGKCDYLGERTPSSNIGTKRITVRQNSCPASSPQSSESVFSLAFGIFAVVLNQSGGGSDTDEHGKNPDRMLEGMRPSDGRISQLARVSPPTLAQVSSERGVAEAADIPPTWSVTDDIRAVFFRERRSAVGHCGLSTRGGSPTGNRGADVVMPEIVLEIGQIACPMLWM